MNTRIKKFAKLRDQVNQEIEMIKLKNENNQKVIFYQKALNRIDPKAFDKINQETQIYFPNFSSLLQVKKTSETKNWNEDKQEITKWLEVIHDIWKDEQQNPKTLEEHLPSLSSEVFVLKKLETWKNRKNQTKKDFKRMIELKDQIERNSPKNQTKKINYLELLETVNKVNAKIQHYDQKLDALIGKKKYQTKWIFWVNLFLFCVLFVCLVLVLIY